MFRIAWKDLSLTFRNPFSLAMMFAAPLLITALLFFAFGNLGAGSGELPVPTTRVAVANLDDPGAAGGGLRAGTMLLDSLQGEELSGLLELRQVSSRAAAVDALRAREVDVAVIIPGGFTLAVLQPGRRATVEVLHDPAAALGPSIVSGLLRHFLDGFSESKIAAEVVAAQFSARGQVAGPMLLRQAAVLLAASALLFRISWGSPGSVLLVMVGTILAAGGFGVMLMSFLRSSRQTGPVMGGVITVVGMLGGLMTTGLPQAPRALERFSLAVPTGWALRD